MERDETKPPRHDTNTFDLLGRQTSEIVGGLEKSVVEPARKGRSNKEKNDKPKGHVEDRNHHQGSLPVPAVMQAALEAIMRGRRNAPPWPPASAGSTPKTTARAKPRSHNKSRE